MTFKENGKTLSEQEFDKILIEFESLYYDDNGLEDIFANRDDSRDKEDLFKFFRSYNFLFLASI